MISTCTEQHKPASPSRHLFPQPRENWGMRRYPAVVKNAPSDFLMARSTSTTGSRDAIGVGPIELARCVHGATRGTIRLMEFVTTNTTAHFVLFSLRRLGVYRLEAGRRGGDMDVTYPSARSNGGCEPATSSYRRAGAIARRAAILLSGTAAIAVGAFPARAIVINDLVVGSQQANVAGYFDSTNVYSNVVSLRRLMSDGSIDSGCTGSLINSRTILTAAHCLYDEKTNQPIKNLIGVSFRGDAVDD